MLYFLDVTRKGLVLPPGTATFFRTFWSFSTCPTATRRRSGDRRYVPAGRTISFENLTASHANLAWVRQSWVLSGVEPSDGARYAQAMSEHLDLEVDIVWWVRTRTGF